MKQPIKKQKNNKIVAIKNVKKENIKQTHPKYGTSKLEEDFAHNFLDKLGIEYVYQYEAKDIKRYFDFRIKDGPILEINGSYWHGDPRIYESKDLNKTQKKNIFVDKIKEKWALLHGIPIYYIWEKDIREDPTKIINFLKEILNIHNKNKLIQENRKKRH